MAALSFHSWCYHQLWVPYTSVLLGLELDVGAELVGVSGPRPGPHHCLGPPYRIFSWSIRYFSSRTLFFTD